MQEVKGTKEVTKEPKEDTRVTREAGTRVEKVTKDSKEEVKEDAEGRGVTKEATQAAKEGTKDGTGQEVTKG